MNDKIPIERYATPILDVSQSPILLQCDEWECLLVWIDDLKKWCVPGPSEEYWLAAYSSIELAELISHWDAEWMSVQLLSEGRDDE